MYDCDLIFKQAEALYNVRLVLENTNGGSGNKIFLVEGKGKQFILRVARFSQKAQEHTEFEVNWLMCLPDSVAKPIKSVGGNLYEVTEHYIMCLFEKAEGGQVDSGNPCEFNPQLFYNLGKVMGQLHKATAAYKGNVVEPKFQWDNDAYSWRGANQILDPKVALCEKKLLAEIHQLPISCDTYGIIHYDIHIDNFFVENGKIKLFDFYDCQFNWYAADIASAIFFMVQKGAGPLTYKSEAERTAFAEEYVIEYLKGYTETNTLSCYWVRKIDLFIKYQMTDEYRAAQNFWKVELNHLKQWYLDWHKERIVNDKPYVFMDYDKIIKALPRLLAE